MNRFTIYFVAALAACLYASVGAAPSGYGSSSAPYAASAPAVVQLASTSEAQAAALTNDANARAAAAKLNAVDWEQINLYGYEIGKPLLVKAKPPITSLWSAALPPRSFVGQIAPAFVKDSYGNVKFIGESKLGVVVV